MATTRGNKSKQAVDGIWGTYGVQISEGGYFPFHTGIKSDHRMPWIRVSLAHIFGHTAPAMRRPTGRNLHLDNTHGQR
eukprot:719074-Ditylum_brightwellii.AAC.1